MRCVMVARIYRNLEFKCSKIKLFIYNGLDMERITRTKNGNIVIYKDNDTFILDADKNEKIN